MNPSVLLLLLLLLRLNKFQKWFLKYLFIANIIRVTDWAFTGFFHRKARLGESRLAQLKIHYRGSGLLGASSKLSQVCTPREHMSHPPVNPRAGVNNTLACSQTRDRTVSSRNSDDRSILFYLFGRGCRLPASMTEVKKEEVVKILHTYPLCRVSPAKYFLLPLESPKFPLARA